LVEPLRIFKSAELLTDPTALPHVNKEIEALTAEYQNTEAKLRQVNPRYAALTRPPPLDANSVQTRLDTETLLLEYSLWQERSYLRLVSATDIQSFELPPKKLLTTEM
jgi:hypothetical protein